MAVKLPVGDVGTFSFGSALIGLLDMEPGLPTDYDRKMFDLVFRHKEDDPLHLR